MHLRVLLIAVTLMLAGCGSSKTNELKLLSENNTHMLYIYPDDMSAELYTGMSLLNNYTLVSITENSYEMTAKGDPTLQLIFEPESSSWLCIACKSLGLSTAWIQQD